MTTIFQSYRSRISNRIQRVLGFKQAMGWPAHIGKTPPARDELAQRLSAVLAKPPCMPPFSRARGIVICAGGWRFFASLYVTVRMIRHVGCSLPIQVWYLGDHGELDSRMCEMLAADDVEWVDGNAVWASHPELLALGSRLRDGMLLRSVASCYSPFAEVLSLDADCYPVSNPEALMAHREYTHMGAAFWPGRRQYGDTVRQRSGLNQHDPGSLATSQFIVDKRRHWPSAFASLWLCAEVGPASRQDDACYGAAWHITQPDQPLLKNSWETHSLIALDIAGEPAFIHRTADKFRLPGTIDGSAISTHFSRPQAGDRNQFCPAIPLETRAFAFFKECDELLRPELHFDTLGHPAPLCEWVRSNRENAYRFASSYSAPSTAIDVGANVGAAAFALLSRGMQHVLCVEPDPRNFAALKKNLSRFGSRVDLRNMAAWRNSEKPEHIPCYAASADPKDPVLFNSFVTQGEAHTVACIGLDALIEAAAQAGRGRVNILKIDAEGAEYPCLFDSKRLDLVDTIVGEYHRCDGIPDYAKVEGYSEYTGPALMAYLAKRGYQVETSPYSDRHGLFWAKRTPARMTSIN